MNILYLYSELMPYNIPVLKIFTEKYSAKVNVISWDNRKLTPYINQSNVDCLAQLN